jgi:hypothetical protein
MTMREDAFARTPDRRAALPFLAVAAWVAALLGSVPDVYAAPLRNGEHIAKHGKLCQLAANKAERRYRIPSQLLSAMSLAESGRYSRSHQTTFPWPWTVRSGAKSHHLPSRAAAVALVKRLQAKGVRNIDIGCMQINLGYHPGAFSNLSLAFNPADNVDYAARFLTKLHKKKRSWALAVGHYHSGLRTKRVPYWRRVVKFWNAERRRAASERRGRIIAEYEERRRQRLALQAERRTRLLLQGMRPPRR